MALFRKKKKKRACVIGLDGVPHSLISRFCEEGVTPALAKILASGSLRKMKVTLPEISSVSWPSFMTGSDPGTHGIFGFIDLRPGTYNMFFPSFRDLKAPALWDKLGMDKKTSVVINQPSTYPARKVEGILISGFVAIDLVKAIYPPSYISKIKAMDYQIDIDTMRSRQDHDFCFSELDRTLAGREKAYQLLWKDLDWDYFELVITGTDRLQHYMWNVLEDPSHANYHRALDYYRKVDALVGKIYERFCDESGHERDGDGFFLLSDHGFCQIKQEVYLNTWLEKEGYISYNKPSPQTVADIAEGTKAFVLDPGRIHINRKGKYPLGAVGEDEARDLIEEIREKLLRLHFEDETVMENVSLRDEVYSGPFSGEGPDLIATAHHGYDLKGSVAKKVIFGRTDLEGMHTWDDAFFWTAGDAGENVHITGLSDMILNKVG